MVNKKDDKYVTLGYLAKLSKINRDTLSFYTRKKLLQPVYTGDNGYKYFLPEQVQTVNFIRFYRQLDFPLETIRDMLTRRDKEPDKYSTDIFDEQQKLINMKINTLQSAAKLLKNEASFIKYIESHEQDTPVIEELNDSKFYHTPIRFCHSLNVSDNAGKIADFFISEGNFSIPEYPICCVIPNAVLLTEHFCAYRNACASETPPQNGITPPDGSDPPSRPRAPFIRPGGKYASMTHIGGTDSIFPSVKKLLNYLKEQKITPAGDAYIINSDNFLNITEEQHDTYIIQIRID